MIREKPLRIELSRQCLKFVWFRMHEEHFASATDYVLDLISADRSKKLSQHSQQEQSATDLRRQLVLERIAARKKPEQPRPLPRTGRVYWSFSVPHDTDQALKALLASQHPHMKRFEAVEQAVIAWLNEQSLAGNSRPSPEATSNKKSSWKLLVAPSTEAAMQDHLKRTGQTLQNRSRIVNEAVNWWMAQPHLSE